MQKLGACLLDAKEDDNNPFTANMNKWAAEVTSLMVCMAVRNPWIFRAFNAAVDASSSPGKACAGQSKSSHLLVCSSMSLSHVRSVCLQHADRMSKAHHVTDHKLALSFAVHCMATNVLLGMTVIVYHCGGVALNCCHGGSNMHCYFC